jgi:hypothetical protein
MTWDWIKKELRKPFTIEYNFIFGQREVWLENEVLPREYLCSRALFIICALVIGVTFVIAIFLNIAIYQSVGKEMPQILIILIAYLFLNSVYYLGQRLLQTSYLESFESKFRNAHLSGDISLSNVIRSGTYFSSISSRLNLLLVSASLFYILLQPFLPVDWLKLLGLCLAMVSILLLRWPLERHFQRIWKTEPSQAQVREFYSMLQGQLSKH